LQGPKREQHTSIRTICKHNEAPERPGASHSAHQNSPTEIVSTSYLPNPQSALARSAPIRVKPRVWAPLFQNSALLPESQISRSNSRPRAKGSDIENREKPQRTQHEPVTYGNAIHLIDLTADHYFGERQVSKWSFLRGASGSPGESSREFAACVPRVGLPDRSGVWFRAGWSCRMS
jgi:hypothetical protein